MESLCELLRPTRGCVCSAYRRASRALTQHYEAAFRGSGLRATQFTLLSTLAQTGPLPLSKLAGALGLERTTLTRNLTSLVARGYVEIEGEGDARVRKASLTRQGEKAVRAAFPRWQAAQRSVAKVLAKLTV